MVHTSIRDICSSSITPTKFIEDFCSILLLPIIKAGSFNGMSSLKEFLLNNVNLLFFMFIDNLLALHY